MVRPSRQVPGPWPVDRRGWGRAMGMRDLNPCGTIWGTLGVLWVRMGCLRMAFSERSAAAITVGAAHFTTVALDMPAVHGFGWLAIRVSVGKKTGASNLKGSKRRKKRWVLLQANKND